MTEKESEEFWNLKPGGVIFLLYEDWSYKEINGGSNEWETFVVPSSVERENNPKWRP